MMAQRNLALGALAIVHCLVWFNIRPAQAGPIASIEFDTTPGGLNRYTLSLDPDGENGYAAVEVTIDADLGQFHSPSSIATFDPAAEGTAVIGLGTITGGFAVIGIGADSSNLDFTFTSFGGPPTASFSGVLAQVTGGPDLTSVTAQFRFADANGAVIEDFTQVVNIGRIIQHRPNLVGSPPPGVLSLQNALNSGSGRRDNAILLSNDGTGDLGELTATLLSNDSSLFSAQIMPGGSVSLMLDILAARQLPAQELSAELLIESEFGGSLAYTMVVRIPEPPAWVLCGVLSACFWGLLSRKRIQTA